jgi:hypothetical protein
MRSPDHVGHEHFTSRFTPQLAPAEKDKVHADLLEFIRGWPEAFAWALCERRGGPMASGFEGGCACGHVRYRLTSGPMFVHCCHCQDCQRQTGSAFVINALIETDRVEKLAGATEAVSVPTDSGRPHIIHRCPQCRVAVWSHYGGVLPLSFIRVGTLDEPSALPPDVHIYTRTKLPWVALPAEAPAFEAYYDSKTLWPQESLERRKAIFG